MSLCVNDRLHGFTVTRVREVPSLHGNFVEMTHDKTGASLCWVDNGESNKLFCVGFKTLPEDDTGVFHILEHSVLCGSEKYPVREPFVELLKSSMNTFLNAMTFPDKTIYPVSSRNDQDFLNLTEVYLDAVFAPRIFSNPNIFYQEGWHYELTDGEAQPTFKGVVFNEMKGAMSDVDEVVMYGALPLLFPDNCYGFNSGGDPRAIPNLTYEQFCNSYRKYYHPSNSRIFLDGNVPLDRVLPLIDGYLSRYERAEAIHPIEPQKPVAAEATNYYEIGAEESPEGKAQFTMGKIIASWDEPVKVRAMMVLSEVLAGSNEAPLKRAILSAGLAQDVTVMTMDEIMQAVFAIQVKNTDADKTDDLSRVIKETVMELVEKGIPRADLEAVINQMEFRVREPQEPQGLIRCITSLGSWLYGGDPLMPLVHEETFAALRKMLDDGGYEQLLKEALLSDEGLCVLHTLPSTTYGEELRAKEAQRLNDAKESWTEQDKQDILALNASLAQWQQTPDTPEQLATLPVLDLKEVSPEPHVTSTRVETVDGVTVLRHDVPCDGIVHLSMYFSLTDFTLPQLSRISLLTRLLGVLPTANYDAAALQQAIRTHLGRLKFDVEASGEQGQTETCQPKLAVRCSVLTDKLDKAIELIHEILTSTCFDDEDRIREIVLQVNEEARRNAMAGGHALGMKIAISHFDAASAASEAISGWSQLQFLREFAANPAEMMADFTGLMKQVMNGAVGKARMTLSLAGDDADAARLIACVPQGTPAPAVMTAKADLPRRLALRVPSQVGYACMGDNLIAMGETPAGSIQVAANILSFDYLWNRIRVQGGAYGAGMRTLGDGVVCYTFRDPTPGRSLGVYETLAEALKTSVDAVESVDKYIISTVAETEPLQSPRQEAMQADLAYFRGTTPADVAKRRQEILATTKESLLAWSDMLTRLPAEGGIAVIANEEALKNVEDVTVFDL